MSAIPSRLRSSVISTRRRLLFPVLSRLDGTDARIEALEVRVGSLADTLAAMHATLEAMSADTDRTAARAANLLELAGEPSAAQLQRRRSDLETLLGSAG